MKTYIIYTIDRFLFINAESIEKAMELGQKNFKNQFVGVLPYTGTRPIPITVLD